MSTFNTNTQGSTMLGAAVAGGALTGNPIIPLTGIGLYAAMSKYPWVGKVLNYATEALRKTAGVGGLLAEAAWNEIGGGGAGPQTSQIDLQKLLETLPEAATAAEQTWRVYSPLPQVLANAARGLQGQPEQPLTAWGGPQAPLKETPITGEIGSEALAEYYNRLVAGESEEQLDREFEQRFGFAGEMTDLAGLMFLDPTHRIIKGSTNLTGKAILKTIPKGALETAEGATKYKGKALLGKALTESYGPRQGIQLSKKYGITLSKPEYESLGAIGKAIFGTYTEEPGLLAKTILGKKVEPGVHKIVAKPEYTNPIGKIYAHLFERTPATKARALAEISSDVIPRLAEQIGIGIGDMDELGKLVMKMASDDPVQVQRIGQALGIGGELAATNFMWKEISKRLPKEIVRMKDLSPSRANIAKVVAASTDDAGKVMSKLLDANGGDAARLYASIVGDPAITPESLLRDAKALRNYPITDEQVMAHLYNTISMLGKTWAAKHYGVAPEAVPYRLFNLMKTAQGMIVLESPGYLFQNTINNLGMMYREGFHFMTKGRAQAVMNKYFPEGMVPARFREGFLTDINTLGKQLNDPITEALKGKPGAALTRAENMMSWASNKFKFFRGKSANMESDMRYIISAYAMDKAMRTWKIDPTGKVGPRPTASAVPGLSRELADMVDDVISDGGTYEGIINKLFKQETVDFTPEQGVRKAAANLGKNYETVLNDLAGIDVGDGSVLEFLANKLPKTPEGSLTRETFRILDRMLRQEDSKKRLSSFKVRAEALAAIADTNRGESVLGVARLFDEMYYKIHDRYTARWMDNESTIAEIEFMSKADASKAVQELRSRSRQRYKELGEELDLIQDTVLDALGLKSQFGRELNASSHRIRSLYDDFYKKSGDETDAYWDKRNRADFDELDPEEWGSLQERHTRLYLELRDNILKEVESQNGLLNNLFVEKYGSAIEPVLRSWLNGNLNTQREMFDEMIRFRTEVLPNIGDKIERRAAWAKQTEDMMNLSAKRMSENIARANEVFGAADYVDRTGGKPPEQPTPEQPAPAAEQPTPGQPAPEGTGPFNVEDLPEFLRVPFEKYFKLADQFTDLAEQIKELQKIRRKTPEQKATFSELKGKSRVLYSDLKNTLDDIRKIKDVDPEYIDSIFKQAQQAYKPRGEIVPNPDPVGPMPAGGSNSYIPQDEYSPWQEMMETQVYPLLRELEHIMADPANHSRPSLKGAKLSPEMSRAVMEHLESSVKPSLASHKYLAMKYAEQAGDNAMLNYNDRFGFDNILNMFFPYQFWYTRSAWNWAMTAIDKPYWIANWYRLREAQDKFSSEQPGMPSRVSGKMRIHLPYMPKDWGDTIYFDPMHQVFPFEAMVGQPLRALQRDFGNRQKRAQYILYEMAQNNEISEQEAERIATMQTGPVWEKAYAQAGQEVKAEINSPMDLVNATMSLSMPLQWALSRKAVKDMLAKTPVKGLTLTEKPYGQKLGQMPLFSTIQNATSLVTPGGVNVPEFVLKGLGVAAGTADDQQDSCGTTTLAGNYLTWRQWERTSMMCCLQW